MNKLLKQTRRPDISFACNGRIRITARVARALSLRPGDVINIAVDGGEYLLHAIRIDDAVGRYEAQCYPTKKGTDSYCANSVRLCRSMLAAAGPGATLAAYAVGLPIQRDSITYLPIITRRPL